MKAAFFALLLTVALSAHALADPPAILAPRVAEIAQADLESRGLQGKIFIEQIIYKKDTIMTKEPHWEVLWSDMFPAKTEGRKEFGLRVTMDGNYKRAVK